MTLGLLNTSVPKRDCVAPPCRQARRREYWPAAGAGRRGRVLRVSLAAVLLQGVPSSSVAFQLPELGLLTLAMLMPIISGGINLAVTFTANLCGLTLAWVLKANGGPDASIYAFMLGSILAVGVGTAAGLVTGPVIAYTGAHPILVSLSVMIFLRGLGEFLTRGADISGFPEFIQPLGHGSIFGIPIPLLILLGAVFAWHILMTRTKLGFCNYMVGSNIEATRYSGISTRRVITLIYALSGAMCALAGIIMVARFNSVRVGHGESYLLITVIEALQIRRPGKGQFAVRIGTLALHADRSDFFDIEGECWRGPDLS